MESKRTACEDCAAAVVEGAVVEGAEAWEALSSAVTEFTLFLPPLPCKSQQSRFQ